MQICISHCHLEEHYVAEHTELRLVTANHVIDFPVTMTFEEARAILLSDEVFPDTFGGVNRSGNPTVVRVLNWEDVIAVIALVIKDDPNKRAPDA